MMRKLTVALLAGLLVASPLAVATAAPPAGAKKAAVLVGIGEYQGRTKPLPGGPGDVAVLRETLLGNGWADANIKVLVNETATAANIRQATRWLVDQSADDSFSVFTYTGHVKQKPGNLDGDGEELDEYLWAHDNAFISDGELATNLRGLRGDAWISIAGCQAAGFDDNLSSPRRLFTAASQEDEKGYERPDWQMSVFHGLMVDQGMSQGLADTDGNGTVSIQEAFNYAARIAPEMTATQRFGPQNPYIAGGDGLEWFLSPPTASTADPSADGGGLLRGGLLGGLLR